MGWMDDWLDGRFQAFTVMPITILKDSKTDFVIEKEIKW